MKKILFIIFINLCIVASVFSQSTILFEDSFNDNSYNWIEGNTDDYYSKVENGKYYVENKDENSSRNIWSNKIVLQDGIDFRLTVELTHISGINSYMYAVNWGIDGSNKYAFGLSDNGSYRYSKYYNDKWESMINWTSSKYINQNNSTNKLKIEKQGVYYKFFINDNYVDTYKSESFFGTKVGFNIDSKQKIAVDNLKIERINEKPELDLSINFSNSNNVINPLTDNILIIKLNNKGTAASYNNKLKIFFNFIQGLKYVGDNNYDKQTLKPSDFIESKLVFYPESDIEENNLVLDIKGEAAGGVSVSKSLVLKIKPLKRGLPPVLFAELRFEDENNNQALEAMENASIIINLTNKGKGSAYNLKISALDEASDKAFQIGQVQTINELKPSMSSLVKIPLKTDINLKTQEHKIKIDVMEYFGYDMDPAFLTLNTYEYKAPKLVYAGLKIWDSGDNTVAVISDGLLQAGEQVKLRIFIQNIGPGYAKNPKYSISASDKNIYLESNTGSLSDMKPGAVDSFNLFISPNKRVSAEGALPLKLNLSEEVGRGSLKDFQIPLTLNSKANPPVIVKIDPNLASLNVKIAEFSFNSDRFKIEQAPIINLKNISASKTKKSKSLGVVIGVEKYDNIVPSPYSANDAEIMTELFKKRLGVEQVITAVNNQTNGFYFDNMFNKYNGELKKAVIKGVSEIFVYYSGHIFPSEDGKQVFLFPADGKKESYKKQGYSLDTLCENLNSLGAKRVFLFIDACFSGVSRSSKSISPQNPLAFKGPVPEPELTFDKYENFIFFTSSSVDLPSVGYDDAGYGLFTYFLGSALSGEADKPPFGNNDKKISLKEIEDFIVPKVSYTAKALSVKQIPEIKGDKDIILIEY